jgi:hypothetical protein
MLLLGQSRAERAEPRSGHSVGSERLRMTPGRRRSHYRMRGVGFRRLRHSRTLPGLPMHEEIEQRSED